jgi:membrane associated rhomboid family serine protease
VLETAEAYYTELLQQLEEENRASRLAEYGLLLAALCAALGLILSRRNTLPGAVLCALGGLLSLLALLFWRSRCPGLDELFPPAALVLAILAALFSEMLFLKRRGSGKEAEAAAAEA